MRLFCLPYAGGRGQVFSEWPASLPPDLELYAIEPPGRVLRRRESPIDDMHVLVGRIVDEIEPLLLDKPFALFGHSMGALVAFELIRTLRRTGLPLPQVLVASGCGAPHMPPKGPPAHLYSDPDFVTYLESLGGVPPRLAESLTLQRLLLPSLRADIKLCELYQVENEPPLEIPIWAIGGSQDQTVPMFKLRGWQEHTSARFELRVLSGGHFFIDTSRELLLAALRRALFDAAIDAEPAGSALAEPLTAA